MKTRKRRARQRNRGWGREVRGRRGWWAHPPGGLIAPRRFSWCKDLKWGSQPSVFWGKNSPARDLLEQEPWAVLGGRSLGLQLKYIYTFRQLPKVQCNDWECRPWNQWMLTSEVENMMRKKIFAKIRNKTITWSSNSISGYLSKENENTDLKSNMHPPMFIAALFTMC